LDLLRVVVAKGILFEVGQVKNFIRMISIHQDVDIKIDVSKILSIKLRRNVNVAVVVPNLTVWLIETKDVVPTIKPVILDT
jgi:hypothetical protein